MSRSSQQPVSIETIREWFVQGSPDADNLVDLQWTIIQENRRDGKLTSFRAAVPKIPFNLLVLSIEEENASFVRLVVETLVNTKDMDPGDKLALYRRLFELAKLPLIKTYLYGPDDTVAVAVDLDLRSLSKKEFDDALMVLAIAYLYLKTFGSRIEELLNMEEVVVLGALVASYIEKGYSREYIRDYLVKYGIREEDAEELISTVYKLYGSKASESRRGGSERDTMFI